MRKDTNAMPKLRRSICGKRDQNRWFKRNALYTLKNAIITKAKVSIHARALRYELSRKYGATRMTAVRRYEPPV